MSRFLLEIGSEEIPARMQAAAAAQLAKRFTEACAAVGLAHGHVSADATPRRLWLIADSLADASAATSEERRGPRADAPDAALQGFLRSAGMARDQLEERDTGKGVFLYAVIKREGRSAADILAEIVPAIITAFDWPKSMRWGSASASTASPRWVRPLTHIVALLGDAVVPASVHGITTGRTSRGHRIHAPGPLEIISADTYAAQLRAAYVYASSFVRRTLIANRAAALAEAAGLTVIPDEGLEIENAGLTEWPVPLLGHFDPAFLAVPREVIQLTMRTNQKYFALADAEGALAPAFICVANMDANDSGTAVVAGNERVLSARLSDAKFFWDQDLAVVKAGGLEAFLPKLENIVFHEKLGTVADKVERVAKLARWLIKNGAVPVPSGEEPGEGSQAQYVDGLAAMAERAARLCKADLVSATVGEFPEVQGIGGGYLAGAAELNPQIATAIRDHYKPVGQTDDVPTAPVSVAVALADKLDTLGRFFANELYPTSSKDPFALRRAALGALRIISSNNLSFDVFQAIQIGLFGQLMELDEVTTSHLWRPVYALDGFFKDRLEILLREEGVPITTTRAVFSEGNIGFQPGTAIRAAKALNKFLTTENGTNLLAGYKRAANILKAEDAKDGPHTAAALDAATLSAPAEQALAQALDAALPTAAAAVAAEDFTAAMGALASLRGPVDTFFTDLMVNAPEPVVRANRLALLARFRDAVHTVADFSRIEG